MQTLRDLFAVVRGDDSRHTPYTFMAGVFAVAVLLLACMYLGVDPAIR